MGMFDQFKKAYDAGQAAGVKKTLDNAEKGKETTTGQAAVEGLKAVAPAAGLQLAKTLFRLTKF